MIKKNWGGIFKKNRLYSFLSKFYLKEIPTSSQSPPYFFEKSPPDQFVFPKLKRKDYIFGEKSLQNFVKNCKVLVQLRNSGLCPAGSRPCLPPCSNFHFPPILLAFLLAFVVICNLQFKKNSGLCPARGLVCLPAQLVHIFL